MRRADRLMKIVHFLRKRRRAVTAQRIGEEFGICTRTVYRDIQDLMNSGTPIMGEAGVGYMIDKAYFLPPVTFDSEELEAISLGISMVRQWTDQHFASKADQAFEKIQAILPAQLQGEVDQITTVSIPNQPVLPWVVSFSDIREAVRKRRKIHITYADGENNITERTVRPIALLFFSPVWMLASWCEQRKDFRHFRLDRMKTIDIDSLSFKDEADKDLKAYRLHEKGCEV